MESFVDNKGQKHVKGVISSTSFVVVAVALNRLRDCVSLWWCCSIEVLCVALGCFEFGLQIFNTFEFLRVCVGSQICVQEDCDVNKYFFGKLPLLQIAAAIRFNFARQLFLEKNFILIKHRNIWHESLFMLSNFLTQNCPLKGLYVTIHSNVHISKLL